MNMDKVESEADLAALMMHRIFETREAVYRVDDKGALSDLSDSYELECEAIRAYLELACRRLSVLAKRARKVVDTEIVVEV